MLDTFIRASDTYTELDRPVCAPYIRRSFELPFVPEEATLVLATPGFYELYVNGQAVTKGYLAPYISNPSDMVCYDTYELSAHLCKGKNAITILLGNGFANQPVHHWAFADAEFRAPLCVAASLTAHGEGQSFTLSSDEHFKTHPSPLLFDAYRYGVIYDARLAIDGVFDANFDDTSWESCSIAVPPKGELVPCTAHPIRCIEEYRPVHIERKENFCYLRTAFRGGEDIPSTHVDVGYLYDFGKSHAGVCCLRIKGKRGQTITLRHGERLTDDGHFTFNSIHTFRSTYAEYIHLFQTDVYTLKGDGEEIFIPPFTYHGYRYVLVEGITEEQATSDLLTSLFLSSDTPVRSSFSCSDERINTLYRMAHQADRSNFHYFPTDCPHREKNGWTGDASVSADHLLLSLDCADSLALWLCSMRHAQRPDGMLPGIVPTSGWGYAWGNGPAWDSACVTVPYAIYTYDGRTDVADACADMIDRYLHYIASRRDENGLIAVGLGDWCQPGNQTIGILSPLRLTDSATVYDIARKAAELMRVTGHTAKAAYADKLSEQMRDAIRRHLIDRDTLVAEGDCLTSQALLLSLGIFTAEEDAQAYRVLRSQIEREGRRLICGMIGLRHIFSVLCEHGDVDLALSMMLRKEAPSYGAMIERGATALCEALEENGVQESENHHFLGDILRIFTAYVAGLRIDRADRDTPIVFSPTPPTHMSYAQASYTTPHGTVRVRWEKTEDGLRASLHIPPQACVRVRYKATDRRLGEGEHTLVLVN